MQQRKHQQSWKIRANNATLFVNPTENDIQSVYSFCEQFRNYFTEFVYVSMSMQKLIKFDEPPIVVDSEDTLAMVLEILKEQKFVFIDVINQTRTSYKGYISWLILATHNQLYAIDSAKLHDKCHEIKQILMRKNLIKFMHQSEEVLFSLKRDFQIFMPNVFDLEVVQRYLNKNGKANIQPKITFKKFLNSIPSSLIITRPLKQTFLQKIQQFYQNQMTIMLHMDKFFATQDPEYQCYAYYNHYELLLKSYFHHSPSVQQIDELHKLKQSASENVFLQYNQHQEVNLKKQVKKQNEFWIKDKEQENIAAMICQWREHIAKMRDINVQEILSYQKVSTLAKTKINSILQISQICSNQPSQIGIYSLSLDEFQQIFELFQLYKQEKQEKAHELIIPRRMPYYKSNQEKPIKQLFQQLKFYDTNNDWLNKKNDQSIKLYKQIVSINEFDNSIVQEYLKERSHQKNSSIHLNIEDINRYIKYAEYLRNGNHKRLQELYERSKQNNKKSKDQQDEQFQENFIQGQEYKNWDEIQNELNLPTMDSINIAPSIDSFKSIKNIDFHSCGNLVNMKSASILKDKKLNSLHQLQSPCYFNKIEPLPQNIEAIYLEAAKAKKNYASKGQKKNNKASKKQSKTSIDKNPKKQEEFIPKKEEIFNLIYY